MSYHRLMMENHTIFSRMVFAELSGEDLSAGQPKILEYLLEHDGAVQKDIAAACVIEPATATSLLCRMEKNGLIERNSRDGDRRYTHVYLTGEGRKKAELSIAVLAETEDIALQGFSQEERELFLKYLSKVNKNLKK